MKKDSEKPKSSHESVDQERELEQEEASSITLRSLLVGILVSAFGAASAQKAGALNISGISSLNSALPVRKTLTRARNHDFQLACLTIGHLAAHIPGPKVWNPGPFSIKETTFSSVMSAAASAGAFSVEMIGARALLFDEKPKALYSLMVMFSSQMIGYGWAGLLCPLLVFPENVVFPSVLPSVALFHSMYKASDLRKKQVSFFKNALLGISIYEIFPTYIAPSLQAISPWCLALPSVPAVSQLFGGSQVGQGLGFLSLSFDWTVLGAAGPLYTPLEAQCNQGVAYIAAIMLFSIAHKHNWLGGGKLPFISFSLLDQDGQVYKTSLVINPDGTENTKAIAELGMPFFATSYILGKSFVCFAASAAFTTAILKKWRTIVSMVRREDVPIDPDREVCSKLKDFPMWGFGAIAAVAIAVAFIALDTGNSGLSNLGLMTAILISFILRGLLFPGNALGTMFFTVFGASTASQSTLMLKGM
ncbi:OPT oligopeptide transporter protein-domain-containing protein [Melampsora americana]|nr:OPT oligopeptide transporter protein-domain-containing protein [Melampsora americana]